MPELGWNVPAAYARHLSTGTPLPPMPDTPEETRQARVDALFEDLARATEGVRYYSLARIACGPDCSVVDRGRPLYRDNNHLSRFGAQTLVGPILGDEFGRDQAWVHDGGA